MMATITFIVRAPFDSVVPGALVKVMDMWETQLIASAITDNNGSCSITLPAGDYMVHAEKEGFSPSYSTYYPFTSDTTAELWLREYTPPAETVTISITNHLDTTVAWSSSEGKSGSITTGQTVTVSNVAIGSRLYLDSPIDAIFQETGTRVATIDDRTFNVVRLPPSEEINLTPAIITVGLVALGLGAMVLIAKRA
jgi:hypothetical protein